MFAWSAFTKTKHSAFNHRIFQFQISPNPTPMKSFKMIFCVVALAGISAAAHGQGFIEPLKADDIGLLGNKPCIVTLASGEEIKGEFKSAVLLGGYLDKISITTADGGKAKFQPEDIVSLKVKAGTLAKLSMVVESASSIKEITSVNFNEIVEREWIIFETALKAKKKDKARLMQLLNPGFDKQIKVYADPEAKETRGLALGGVKLTGGEDKSYLLVKDGTKAVKVKKKNYRDNFDELYAACPKMLTVFEGDKIKWADVAGHVFVYNQVCE